MNKLLVLAAIMSVNVYGSTHYRPEEYNAMNDMDKATVVVNASSDAINNRTVIDQNHRQAMDLGYENYEGVLENSKISAKNALLINANSKTGEINRAYIDELFARPQYNDSYVKSRIENNSSRITQLDRKVDEDMAMAAAFSGLPRAFKNESVIGGSVGHSGGVNALAIGVEHSIKHWSGNLGVAKVGKRESYKIGFGYHW